MWRSARKTCAMLALMTLASLAAIAPVNAQSEAERDRPEHRPTESTRPSAHQEAPAPHSRTYPERAQSTYMRPRQSVGDRGELAGRSITATRPMAANVTGARLTGSVRAQVVSRSLAGGQIHAIRYGNTLNGTVE